MLNAVKLFFDYWETSSEKDLIGALGANLLNENGDVVHSYGFFPNPFKEVFILLARLVKIFCVWLFNINSKSKSKSLQSAFWAQ